MSNDYNSSSSSSSSFINYDKNILSKQIRDTMLTNKINDDYKNNYRSSHKYK
jgi:hypothetical protein